MKIEIHDSLEAVGPSDWDALQAGSRLRSPFLTWVWQSEWVQAFGEGRRLEVRRVTDGTGQLVAVLPLIELRPGHLMLTGGSDVSDYLDLIALRDREEEAWTALLGARATERSVWELHAVPAASPTIVAGPALAAAEGLRMTSVVEERCPVLHLPNDWETYLASLPGKHRHELSRKIRRFEREEPSGRITIETTSAAIAGRLNEFLDLHRQSRVGKARFMDERMEGFFRRVILALAEQGAARLAFLETPAGPIASFVTLEWDDRVGLYNSGFRPDSASLSPGLVLLAGVVRDALERGRRCFDFLRGEERYKYEFGPVPEAVHAVTIEGGG